ncbi:ATP-binding protein [Brevibacterium litoralis]|uniref:ATP-binding protein n=1 Tax=Brevibacterium litoralis TaxID=3138935 RepID=UPI0032EEDF02
MSVQETQDVDTDAVGDEATEVAADQDVLPMQVTDGGSAEQFRITRVQVLNWGNYRDLHDIPFTRDGLAIAGPSGRGKSTLVDAMSSVLFPNPQQFNVAARDDGKKRSERTVYSYARGYTERRERSGGRGTTTAWVRPPSGGAFPSGTAITFRSGQTDVTVFRLMWVAPHVQDRESLAANTVYGFVHEDFDLERIRGLDTVRGSSPLSRSSLARLVDEDRGDVVDTSQSRIHVKMRSVLGMGANEDSQRHAFQLLRRAQSSKDLEPIDEFFKTFVLTEPEALGIWDDTAGSFLNASRFYDEFESARTRTETLAPLPDLAAEYRASLRNEHEKRLLVDAVEEGTTSPVTLWHGRRVLDWADKEVQRVRERATTLGEDRKALDRQLREVETGLESVRVRIEDAGGGLAAENLRLRMEAARGDLQAVRERAEEIAADLAEFGLRMPTDADTAEQVRAEIAARLPEKKQKLQELRDAAATESGRLWELRGAVEKAEAELRGLKGRRSAVPEDADARRHALENALGLSHGTLVYAGELMRLAEGEQRWEKAVTSVVMPLARTLLVPQEHFERLRAHVDSHDMRGSLTFTAARSGLAEAPARPDSVPSRLELADHEFAGWVSQELTATANVLCVETPQDLDSPLPDWALGAITPAGLRTGTRGRFTKDDRPQRYPWIGWDNRSLVSGVQAELDGARERLDAAETAARETERETVRVQRAVTTLHELPDRLTPEVVDLAELEKDATDLEARFEATRSPESVDLEKERADLEVRRAALTKRIGVLEKDAEDAEREWAALADLQDSVHDLVDGAALTEVQEEMLAGAEFRPPSDASSRAVAASRRVAEDSVRAQIAVHAQGVEAGRMKIEGLLAGYRSLGPVAARETDGSVDSLDAVLAVYDRLVRDDLPRAKEKWLQGASKDLVTGFGGLLMQIDSDERTIAKSLDPINSVLRNISFRGDSVLSIEVERRATRERTEFREVIDAYSRERGAEDAPQDAEAVEESFLRLRTKLEGMIDPTKVGETWRHRVFDARENMSFKAVQTRPTGDRVPLEGVGGMSGGEGQELIAFVLGAALRMRLSEGTDAPPVYAPIVLDEGFVKADSDFTARALGAFKALGFQLVIAAPREKAGAFDRFVGSIVYVNHAGGVFENGSAVQVMTAQEFEDGLN